MYAKRLSIENQRAVDPCTADLVVPSPRWDQIESAIRQLDGKYRTLIILGQDDAECDYMVIGGGKDGLYCCDILDREAREYVVVDPSKSLAAYVMVPIGQPTKVPLWETIGIHEVIVAARRYAETGERSPDLTWLERK